ncbi:hypothetical protein H6G65_03700 [Microcystis elabens FACHB-917]|nr:hypothetical protein [Microcystis elabens FACHB-917]
MTTYRKVRLKTATGKALRDVPASVALPAAAAASAIGGVEAFRSVPFDALPADVIDQLRSDGTRDGRRSLEEAREVYETNVPAEAKGSIEGVRAITNDPEIDWMHIEPHAQGGSNEAANGVYGPGSLNSAIGAHPMTPSEVAEAQAHTRLVAEEATPAVTGDLGEVVGDTLETGAYGGAIGGGLAVVHRIAQAQGYRDAGRHDLAAAAEEMLAEDAAKGAINGVVRGTSVAVTQAILGANPLTAGIGLVAPDVVMLLSQQDQLSEEEFTNKALGVAGKGAIATALACAGPIGWIGLAGWSIACAYGKATEQASSSSLRGV